MQRQTNSSDPSVSVVICAYNVEQYLEKSIRSILTQTFNNLELIVVDDASTDDTAVIASAAVEKDHRVRLIRHSENKGLAHARMTGLDSTRSDLVLFLDGDDLALPDMLEKQVEIIQSDSNIIGVATYAYYIGDDDSKKLGIQRIGPTSKKKFMDMYKESKLVFLPATTLCRKKMVVEAGGFRLSGLPVKGGVRFQDYCDDLDLWCRLSDLAAQGKYFVTIPIPLFLYRKSTGSISAKNVFVMQQKMRWIKDCLKHRRAGIQERSFLEYQRNRSLLRKLDNLREDCAAYLYKATAFSFLQGRYFKAFFLLLGVCVLSPFLVIQKVRTQKIKVDSCWTRKHV
ncbi:MAG: glycosyltransferase [Deltaproteobacteria bacterium]|nr:glycosyltransferase [Deltaproteobacteria bacterium]